MTEGFVTQCHNRQLFGRKLLQTVESLSNTRITNISAKVSNDLFAFISLLMQRRQQKHVKQLNIRLINIFIRHKHR